VSASVSVSVCARLLQGKAQQHLEQFWSAIFFCVKGIAVPPELYMSQIERNIGLDADGRRGGGGGGEWTEGKEANVLHMADCAATQEEMRRLLEERTREGAYLFL
jgi:hypothetical protein